MKMRQSSWRGALLAAGLVAAAFAPIGASAVPVVYSITSGGLDGAHICANATNCTGTQEFLYAPPAAPPAYDAATGTITLDSAAGTVAFNLGVSSATFLAVLDVPDNGVDEIEFSSLAYTLTLTGATFTPDGFGNTVISWAAQTPAGTTVAGSYQQFLNAATVNGPDPFAVTARASAGVCTLTAANYLTCGLILGPGGPFTLNVGPDGSPVARRAVHSLNVVSVPEPGTALLLVLGIAGVSLRGRSR
jgi:hypothetical protein